MSPLSHQERLILHAIQHLEIELGRRPYQQEIAHGAGFRSKASANKYIKSLEAKGHIQRDYNAPSTLRVRPKPDTRAVAANAQTDLFGPPSA